MFSTEATVTYEKGSVVQERKYQKEVFDGTALNKDGDVIIELGEDGNPKVTPLDLLKQAIDFAQKEVGEKGNGILQILKMYTYGRDLGVRAKIRQAIVKSLEGPDKSIEKQAKSYFESRLQMGKPVTMEVALARVKAMLAEE